MTDEWEQFRRAGRPGWIIAVVTALVLGAGLLLLSRGRAAGQLELQPEQRAAVSTRARPPRDGLRATRGCTHRWCRLPMAPLSGRRLAATVWTGKRMLVWGGLDASGQALTDGASYAPSSQTWSSLPAAPIAGRGRAAAVWTGTRALVWGGRGERGELADGAMYTLSQRTWTRLPQAPLLPRQDASAVWTGRRVIVWGGRSDRQLRCDGAAYDPATRRWLALPRPPTCPRAAPAVAWTGERLLVVGDSHTLSYDPPSRRWRRLRPSPVDAPRPAVATSSPPQAWTGAELLIWRERELRPPVLLRYRPAGDRWRVAAPPPLRSRVGATMVWTGHRLAVWGGAARQYSASCMAPRCRESLRPQLDGAWYEPKRDVWTTLPAPPLTGRAAASAVSTGEQLIIWGGRALDGVAADGAALPLPED